MTPHIPPPQELGLQIPSWRTEQPELLTEIVESIRSGHKVIVDAPPAFGKTVIAGALPPLLEMNTVVLTATKALQAAYAEPPTSLPMVTGRRNHICSLVDGVKADEAPCRYDFQCSYRDDGCPYFRQRDKGLKATTVVVNYAMALSDSEATFLQNKDLLICDEAHLLEGQLANYLGIDLPMKPIRYKPFGIPSLPKNIGPSELSEWGQQVRDVTSSLMEQSQQHIDSTGGGLSRQKAHMFEALRRLQDAVERLIEVDSTWAMRTKTDSQGQLSELKLIPTNVAELAKLHLWDRVPSVVLMSGSIIDASAFLKGVGLADGDVAHIKAANTIPADRRPIVYSPEAEVSQSEYPVELPRLASAIDQHVLAQMEAGEWRTKGLIHTVNRTVADYLMQNCRMAPYFMTHGTDNRREVFEEFRAARPPAVLLSPSAHYGEDFPDHQADWQIIAKIPFPHLGDPWIKAKMRLDSKWYTTETVAALVQMVARVVRSPEDFGITMILDSNFERLWQDAQNLFPDWFREAVVWPGER